MPHDGMFGSRPEVGGISETWRSRSSAEQEKDIERLVSSNHALQAALRSVKTLVANTTQSGIISHAIQAAEVQSAVMNDIQHEMFETKYFNYQHGAEATTTATDFFDVAEICERVLMDLPIADVLAMHQVSKRTFDIIKGSPKLQRKLHIAPAPNAAPRALAFRPNSEQSYFPEPASNLRNPCISFTPPFQSAFFGRGFGEHTVSIYLQPEDYLKQPPGARIRCMLLCQPPVVELEVELSCCGHTSMASEDFVGGQDAGRGGAAWAGYLNQIRKLERHGKKLTKLRREAGVTVGDVWDIFTALTKAHELCPRAGLNDHDNDGFVKVTVQFHGAIHVKADQEEQDEGRNKIPNLIQQRAETVDAQSTRVEEREKHIRLLVRYMEYKEGGKSSVSRRVVR